MRDLTVPSGIDRAARDLLKAHPVDEPHEQHLSVGLRQARQDGAELRPLAAGVHRFGGGGVGHVDRVRRRHPRAFPPGGDGEVFDDRVEERRHARGEAKAGELAEDVREGLLEHVERVVVAAREPPGEAHDPVAVAVIQRVERAAVAGVEASTSCWSERSRMGRVKISHRDTETQRHRGTEVAQQAPRP
jgi:hypothetical protein